MGLLDGSDVVRIGGRTFTRSRAIALGYVKAVDGVIVVTAKGKAMADSQGQKVERAKAREAEWRRRQGFPEEPETTEDGVMVEPKPKRKPRVLKPRNVTPAGEEVTDEATLAKIAAEADEKAKSLALAAHEGADG